MARQKRAVIRMTTRCAFAAAAACLNAPKPRSNASRQTSFCAQLASRKRRYDCSQHEAQGAEFDWLRLAEKDFIDLLATNRFTGWLITF